MEEKKMNSQQIEGRNAVMEAFRSGKPIDKVYILDGCQDGPVRTIVREAKKHDTIVNFVPKERLDSMSETGHHQGVMAYAAAYEYAEVEDILKIFSKEISLSNTEVGKHGITENYLQKWTIIEKHTISGQHTFCVIFENIAN